MNGAVIIEHELFDIAARLKTIDDGYFVVYNFRTHAFEVHHSRQRGHTFALSVPYPSLDVRTELLVRKTRAENARRLLREMEEENARLRRRQAEQAVRQAQMRIEEEERK